MFGILDQEQLSSIIQLMYFAFTTLSTVGLGDMHPRSDEERLIGSMVLLFGVAVTSFIMENLNKMLFKFQEINQNFEQDHKLSQFFGTIERFNGDTKLPQKV